MTDPTPVPAALRPDGPLPPAPDGLPFLVRTRLVFDLPWWVDDGPQHTWHATFDEAVRHGQHSACLSICRWVTVHAPDGTVECHWRHLDDTGAYDNTWHDVGAQAAARRAASLAEIHEQMRAMNAPAARQARLAAMAARLDAAGPGPTRRTRTAT